LRFGRKYGFNFTHNREEKVGVLRSFVKRKKNEERRGLLGRIDSTSFE
jgi:hypothetical protein